MFWLIAATAIVALLVWSCYIRPYSYWKNLGVPQVNPWIFMGDMWPLTLRSKNVREFMDWIYYKYPKRKFVGIYQYFQPVLCIRDPDMIKQITVKDFDYFTDHKSFSVDEETDPLWGRNLFSLRGQKWRDMRSLLSGSFTSSKMKIMYNLITEESEKFVNYFLKKNEDVTEVEFKNCFTRYSNDVIASTSFGIKIDSMENPDNVFFQMGKEVSDFTGFIFLLKLMGTQVFPGLYRLLKIGILSKRASKFFTEIIYDTIKVREEQHVVRPDMINLLLEVKNGKNREEGKSVPDSGFAVIQESTQLAMPSKKQIKIVDEDIASQALLFFLAGFETTSTALCFLTYELAINSDIQRKLREEIKETYQRCNGKPLYEDILGMKYLDMVISEGLRKWPPAINADRMCVKPYTLNSTSPEDPAIHFNVGDVIWIPTLNIHRDPKYFPNPEKFIPERFSEKNKVNIIPYTYMPFGLGPRACIGSRFALLEMKSVIFNLVNNFEIIPTQKTQIPLKLNKAAFSLIPLGGFPLGLKKI